ncbi:superoxide dismutase family protein [Paenibacillus protaetiae]|uniref:Superoxide dismutase [Cu-Zn] n=1 Tax=Paenibacillus protaetiae TaxID=2509456 RepID=A0A4P6EWB4_9BACL|nr:superoxide dismutase family protein [Paenibacillus protaetiae]QAY66473.1 superoxide dismutase family protein [Paenibacillus protaetiae]
MNKRALLACFSAVALSAGSLFAQSVTADSKETAGTASVSIINAQGEKIGTAGLKQEKDGVHIHLTAEKLPPGTHGFHFHMTGKCDPPKFESAGSHFNPFNKEHGFHNPKGFHAGDLPNIEVGADGKINVDIKTEQVTLDKNKPNSLLKEGGTAIVIHEKADDYVTDPSGNSGDRIACGVIR